LKSCRDAGGRQNVSALIRPGGIPVRCGKRGRVVHRRVRAHLSIMNGKNAENRVDPKHGEGCEQRDACP